MLRGGQKLYWIPDARYDEGFFTRPGNDAAGWQIPQPWVIDDAGATVRLDDIVAGRWTVLHTGVAPAGVQAWTDLGVPAIALGGPRDKSGTGAIRDIDGTLIAWLRGKKAAAVVLRPDGFIYAAAETGQRLPAPPAGYELAPTRTGAHT